MESPCKLVFCQPPLLSVFLLLLSLSSCSSPVCLACNGQACEAAVLGNLACCSFACSMGGGSSTWQQWDAWQLHRGVHRTRLETAFGRAQPRVPCAQGVHLCLNSGRDILHVSMLCSKEADILCAVRSAPLKFCHSSPWNLSCFRLGICKLWQAAVGAIHKNCNSEL